MSPLGVLHTACGSASLAVGAVIFLRAKATRGHVRLGWTYAACMAGVNGTALGIYRLTGHLNLFHGLAVLSLVLLAVGLLQVVRAPRPNHWAWRHYQYMSWSYVGLLAATNNEAFVRVPALARLSGQTTRALPLIATAVLVVAGGIVIIRFQTAVLARALTPPASDPQNVPDPGRGR